MTEDRDLTVRRIAAEICKRQKRKGAEPVAATISVLEEMVDMISEEVLKNNVFDMDSEIEFCIWDKARQRARRMKDEK